MGPGDFHFFGCSGHHALQLRVKMPMTQSMEDWWDFSDGGSPKIAGIGLEVILRYSEVLWLSSFASHLQTWIGTKYRFFMIFLQGITEIRQTHSNPKKGGKKPWWCHQTWEVPRRCGDKTTKGRGKLTGER